MSTPTVAPLVVRFAPSPTGSLHLGNARTALFNWLYARRHGGRFLLRIEDTDRSRNVADAATSIKADLEWLGLHWDGPAAVQSEFEPRHRELLAWLLERDRVYRCFCTAEELDARRAEATRQGKPPHYDGRCRRLDKAAVTAKLEAGAPFSVRFKAKAGAVVFRDLVYGERREKIHAGADDFVLWRAGGGGPTYMFANIADDADAGVTHVFRGIDLMPATARQVALYEALERPGPVYGHLPLIVGTDRQRLSKRHGSSSLAELRAQGFLSEAVVNMLALLGFSPPDGRELHTPAELAAMFDIARVGRSPAVFDQDKLRHLNQHHLRALDDDALVARLSAYSAEFAPAWAGVPAVYPAPALAAAVRENAATLHGAAHELLPLLADADYPRAVSWRPTAAEHAVLAAALQALDNEPGVPELAAVAKAVTAGTGQKGRAVFQPLRLALTGAEQGPELKGLFPLLGRDRLRARFANALRLTA